MRVLVVGSGGAGKSTLARRLGAQSHTPVIHLDSLYWRRGWVEPSPDEWQEQLGPALAAPAWIIDGNYGATVKQRAAAADLVIVLDRPRVVCLANVLRRWWRYRGTTRPDMAEGCPEHVTWEFLRYCWDYRRVSLPKLRRRVAESGCPEVITLRSRRDIEAFAAAWPGRRPPPDPR